MTVKARTDKITCECCGHPVQVGQQVTMHAGRYWITGHLLAYKAQRRQMKGAVL